MRVLGALVSLLVGAGFSGTAMAQRALQATGDLQHARLPAPLLTLRPAPGLRRLARDVAVVLELRTGDRVEVGSAPPPGLIEAVPAGHIAMARRHGAVLLVLGAAAGRSFDATVRLSGESLDSDARAVALAAEALRDDASDPPLRLSRSTPARARSGSSPRAEDPSDRPKPAQGSSSFRDGAESGTKPEGLLGNIDPLIYVRLYTGASTASSEPMAGLGSGLGLCVERHCLFLAGELPLTTGSLEHLDVRYRYPTFVSGFYTRPFSFGSLTPGASIGFLTRLGHFRQDMGYKDTGLDTDLGARGSLELAWLMASRLDLIGEGGVDLTLDRRQVGYAEYLKNRGDRWSPWAQVSIRYRP